MASKRPDLLSSRSLLERISLNADQTRDLMDEDDPLETPQEAMATALSERYTSYASRHVFQPGDLVTWKPGLRNRRYPRPDRPAIVIEVLSSPIRDSQTDSGYTYFREPLDVVLGVFLEEGEHRGDFLMYHFDSAKLQPWLGERK